MRFAPRGTRLCLMHMKGISSPILGINQYLVRGGTPIVRVSVAVGSHLLLGRRSSEG